jgi:hypothetical protein
LSIWLLLVAVAVVELTVEVAVQEAILLRLPTSILELHTF